MKVTEKGEEYSQLSLNDEGSSQRDSAEHEEYAGAYRPKGITENNITDANEAKERLLEQILGRDNMNQAYKRVKPTKERAESIRCR